MAEKFGEPSADDRAEQASKRALGIALQHFGGVEGCISIDSTPTPPDNGAMNCWRQHYPRASNHNDFGHLAHNLAICLFAMGGPATRVANIVGHGNDGFVVANVGAPQKEYIGWWNEQFWHDELRVMLQRANIVKIWACHPGTGEVGASLLYSLSLTIGATCMGPTGFLYCGNGGIYLEPNSTWQVAALHGEKPKPIEAPTEHFLMRYNEFSMPSPEGERTYKAAEVKHILITRRGRVRLEVIGPDAMDVLRLIDLREPVQLPGVPLAIETGELRISLVDTNRNEATLDFTLFNDRLAQSRTPPFGYYKCSAYLRELLSTNIDDRL